MNTCDCAGTSAIVSPKGNSAGINVASGVRAMPSAASTSSSKVPSSVDHVSTTQPLSQHEITALSEELEALKDGALAWSAHRGCYHFLQDNSHPHRFLSLRCKVKLALSEPCLAASFDTLQTYTLIQYCKQVLLAMYLRTLLQTSAELAHYLDIKIKLARAGGLSCRSGTSRTSEKVDEVNTTTANRVTSLYLGVGC